MGKMPSYSKQEINLKVAEYLGRSPAGIKRMYYLMTRDKREKEILSKLQYPNKLEVGEKYRVLITDQRKYSVKRRLFTGTVILVTEKFTVFQFKNYKECFLNWDLERAEIKEV